MPAKNNLSNSLQLKVQAAQEKVLCCQEQLQREAATDDSHLLNSDGEDDPNVSNTIHFKGQTPAGLHNKDNEYTEGESESSDSDQADSDEETGKTLLKFQKLV